MNNTLFKDGEFFIGANYWASHAGTNMWHDWRPDIIEKDLELLAKNNIKSLRVFPMWPDFQPIKMHYTCATYEWEVRMGEDPLPQTEAGKAGIDETMVERFKFFCDVAEKNGIKLVVGLLTGWMSGRLYVPPYLDGKNVLTDPAAIKWEIKFVKYMVKTFKDHPAIAAWDLGNECNCLGVAGSHEAAYLWVSTITNAIKSEDNQKPVVSGMHSTFPEYDFRPQDMGEILDIMCTHPYPLFTPHCDTDPITEHKSAMHAVAETVMYRGFSGKPAFAEEVGTLGPMIASNENSAEYTNKILHLLWSHNCLGFMWWCAFEQSHLNHTPYDWIHLERELGLFYTDGTFKPTAAVLSDFAKFAEEFEYKKLPDRIVDAVCVIGGSPIEKRESWLPAFGTFILAKQAGLDIEFCYNTQKIPEANAYILPSLSGAQYMSIHALKEILSRVENGASLYVSFDACEGFADFEKTIGLKVLYRQRMVSADKVELGGETFEFMRTFKTTYAESGAEVIARDDKDTPVMSKTKYGKGTIYFVAYPLEKIAGDTPSVISGENETAYYKFYEAMPLLKNSKKRVTCDNCHVVITEHIVDENTRLVVAVNCIPRDTKATLSLDGFKLSKTIKNQDCNISADGNRAVLDMKANKAVVIEIKKG